MTDPSFRPAGAYNAGRDLVDRHVAQGRGDKVAYIDGKRELTFGALQEQSDRFACALHELGGRREQRVALILLDTIEFPVAFFGILKAGMVAVPFNTLLAPEQWRYMLEDTRAEVAVVSSALLEPARAALSSVRTDHALRVIVVGDAVPADSIAFDRLTAAPRGHACTADTHADETAFWLYTSGSTGPPKAARHPHASPRCTAELYGRGVLEIDEDDVLFSAAKLFFAYGLGNSMSFPLLTGATTILSSERPTPAVVLQTMRSHHPTVFFGVPSLFASLLSDGTLGPGAGSRRLRTCVSAGEALPAAVAERWKERVGVDILDGIGSTEMLHIFISNRIGGVRYESSGTPVPGYEARIVDEGGAVVGVNEIGELIVKGPTAAEGYWHQRERSQRTFIGEWTKTGDKYRRDADGYFYYCGRTDDMFKVSGVWCSPFDVESALVSHPAVLEAAVVAQEDLDGLTKPKAFVVLEAGTDLTDALRDELRAHVKARTEPWRSPRWIETIPTLPKTATGKIERYKLRGR
jgi:4-hydroxybenzoate-CoA ligase